MLIKSFEQGVKVVEKRLGISELFAEPLIALCICSCYHRKRYKAEYYDKYCDGCYLDDILYDVIYSSDFLEELCDSLGLKVIFPNSFLCKPVIKFSNSNGDRFVFEPFEDIFESGIYYNTTIRDSVISGLFSYCSRQIVKQSRVDIPMCQEAYIIKDNDILTYYGGSWNTPKNQFEIGKLSLEEDVSKHYELFVKALSETSFEGSFNMEDEENEEV
jgi:hypothetical protein